MINPEREIRERDERDRSNGHDQDERSMTPVRGRTVNGGQKRGRASSKTRGQRGVGNMGGSTRRKKK